MMETIATNKIYFGFPFTPTWEKYDLKHHVIQLYVLKCHKIRIM